MSHVPLSPTSVPVFDSHDNSHSGRCRRSHQFRQQPPPSVDSLHGATVAGAGVVVARACQPASLPDGHQAVQTWIIHQTLHTSSSQRVKATLQGQPRMTQVWAHTSLGSEVSPNIIISRELHSKHYLCTFLEVDSSTKISSTSSSKFLGCIISQMPSVVNSLRQDTSPKQRDVSYKDHRAKLEMTNTP